MLSHNYLQMWMKDEFWKNLSYEAQELEEEIH